MNLILIIDKPTSVHVLTSDIVYNRVCMFIMTLIELRVVVLCYMSLITGYSFSNIHISG